MNTINSTFESELRLKSMYISDISFKRERNLGEKLKLNFLFKPDFSISDNDIDVSVEGVVSSEDDSLEVKVTVVASFECRFSDGVDLKSREEIQKKNSLSIIFPYLRSQISTVTAQPGLMPLVIPAINLNAYLDSNKN